MTLRTAVAAWKIRPAKRDSQYFGHFYDLVHSAHDQGAQVVVFPELHVLELLPIAKDLHEAKAARYLAQYAKAVEDWIVRIAQSSGMTLVGGSHFRETDRGIKNVCAVGLPDGSLVIAEKNNLTGYEADVWKMSSGRGLAKANPYLGVTICYDSEFPEAGRALAESGVLLQCVPSWTETQRGFQRVRWSCLARAVENQIFVAHSALVGDLGREPVPTTYGSSALIAPSIEPFPVQAVLSETPLNEEGLAIADLDFGDLLQARRSKDVANWEHRRSGDWTVSEPGGLSSQPRQTENDRGELN